VPPPDILVDVSVVMPCLDEAATVGECVRTALATLRKHGMEGEVVVCDNGSSDGSAELARQAGARVVVESRRGYGFAYQTGLRHARGRYLVIGDSDGTYDFTQIPQFVERLRSGDAFVSGTRFRGGSIDGMPWLHRYLGNPVLTALLAYLFQTPLSDVYCGLRAFTREAYGRIAPLSPGMEFNLELAINACKAGLACSEIPIRLRARQTPAKLRTFRDGWRSLRFVLLYSPNSLFLVPAVGCLAAAALAFGLSFLLPALHWPDIWVQLEHAGTVLAIVGGQILQCWVVAKTYSLSEQFERENPFLTRFSRWFSLEKGLMIGAGLLLVGVAISAGLLVQWARAGFVGQSNRLGYVALTCLAMSVQVITGSFFVGMLLLRRDRNTARGADLS
jgi:glycosyltransferase involved in cell wall biosynthesis